MPLFEYRCLECHHEFEYLQQVGESNPETCPKCGVAKPEKKKSSFSTSGTASGGGAPAPSCPTGSCPYAQ